MNLHETNLSYQTPPKEILEIVNVNPVPALSVSPDNRFMLSLQRPEMPGIEDLAQPELRLAGIRINPATNSQSRAYHFTAMELRTVENPQTTAITGLPEDCKIEHVAWSPNSAYVAFSLLQNGGNYLWLLHVNTATARCLTHYPLNNTFGGVPFQWLPNSRQLVFTAIDTRRGAPPQTPLAPVGPLVKNSGGTKAASRTYQDLLKTEHDCQLFSYYFTSQLMLANEEGNIRNLGQPSLIRHFSVSPNGQFVLLQSIEKPFSFSLPYTFFPLSVQILNMKGQLVKQVAQNPLLQNVPLTFGSVSKYPRNFGWRADVPDTLYWVEAQDEGDAGKPADVRDKLWVLPAPFTQIPQCLFSFSLRFSHVFWGNGKTAVAVEWWWKSRREIVSVFSPDEPHAGRTTLFDRNWEDQYTNPGDFVKTHNHYGKQVLLINNAQNCLYLSGEGASEQGFHPFLDRLPLSQNSKPERIWQSKTGYYETLLRVMDTEAQTIAISRESEQERPNYFLLNLQNHTELAITHFAHPYPQLKGVKKQVLKYVRPDGVRLSGTLYTPPGYNPEKHGTLPVLMWAYPREFKTADTAGQLRESQHRFLFINGASPLFWLTRGYAVFNDFSMPIVGEGSNEPNDTYIEQLVANARAAVNALTGTGIADPNRIAIGGHSYGAFMTANLLAHCSFFAAGIARSGAYNRTLTPFGFQSEERTYWQSPETYHLMSPFTYAHQIKTPLLLIHGEADNNPGTFPTQTERFFNALKGHGAPARLVMLPLEGHGYAARQSVLHVLWEMDNWLEQHVKSRKIEVEQGVGAGSL
ncbi:S9 family peptidase [Sphingobacteriales bacterium UPWRP_1]|nr:hypothetical protein BVG80_01310 [Sphingobacteriales bacterium TSM_CSM]PSJ72727.1 S9 family peptidase [Sphingobacteriales bacterium UPWRP_1]